MRRYWISPESLKNDTIVLEGDLFHHIHDVCRQGVGDKFEVLLTGSNAKALLVEVVEVGKKRMAARVLEERQLAPRKRPYIHLCMCLPRFAVFESVLEKAVELGVYSIQPLFSEFSFVRTPEKVGEAKLQRWQKIIQSAVSQSGRGDWLQIEPLRELSEFLPLINQKHNALCLFAYEGEGLSTLREKLETKTIDDVYIFVGAEGGFSTQECELFKQHGHSPISLGEQVLRVETACVTLVSVIKYQLGLF